MKGDAMRHAAFTRKVALVFFLLPVFLLMGCSSAVQVRLPENMVSFRDAAKKMEFRLPAGWEPAPVEPVIEKSTYGIRDEAPVGFRKGEKGTLAVWCDHYDSNRPRMLHMIDVLKAYAPLFKPAEIYFEVDSPGSGFISRPNVHVFKASHVVKGEKKNFQIVTVVKGRPATVLYGCEYMLFGRSASDEYSEEITTDITAIAATLMN